MKKLPSRKVPPQPYENFAANIDRFLSRQLRIEDISFESSEKDFDIFDPVFSSQSSNTDEDDGSSFTDSDDSND